MLLWPLWLLRYVREQFEKLTRTLALALALALTLHPAQEQLGKRTVVIFLKAPRSGHRK